MYLNPTDLDLYMDLYQFVLTHIVDKSRKNTLDFISLKIHAWFPGFGLGWDPPSIKVSPNPTLEFLCNPAEKPKRNVLGGGNNRRGWLPDSTLVIHHYSIQAAAYILWLWALNLSNSGSSTVPRTEYGLWMKYEIWNIVKIPKYTRGGLWGSTMKCTL